MTPRSATSSRHTAVTAARCWTTSRAQSSARVKSVSSRVSTSEAVAVETSGVKTVDGGVGDTEQVRQLRGAVVPCVQKRDEVSFLAGVELGLLPPQPTLGLGDLHALAGAQPDQVGLKLGDHRQHAEQQPPHRIGRIVDGAPEVESDPANGQFVLDCPRVMKRAGQPVELGDDQGVALTTGCQGFA